MLKRISFVKILLFPALFVIFSCLSACSHEMPEEIITSQETGSVQEESESVRQDTYETDMTVIGSAETTVNPERIKEADGYPVVVNDERVLSRPEGVISLSEPLTGIICELGASDRLKARSTYCSREELAELPDAGKPSAPDIQLITGIRPDVLITATSIDSTLRLRLEEYGITVIYIPAPRSVEELENIYTCLGAVLYGSDEGSDKAQQAFEPVKTAFSQADSNLLGKTLYITEGLSVAGEDTFEASVLSYLGEPAISGESGYIPPDSAALLAEDVQADTVVVNSAYTYDDLISDSFYAAFDAVKQKRVIFIDNKYFEEPDSKLSELPGLIRAECLRLGITVE